MLALALLVTFGTLLQAPHLAFALVAIVARFASLVAFAVACQRRFLVAGEPVDVLTALTWRRRHWTYLLAMLLIVAVTIGSLAAALSLTNAATGEIVGLPAAAIGLGLIVAALYASSRLASMLPAAAIEAPAEVSISWMRTEGNGWRLVLINILAALPPTLANAFVAILTERVVATYALQTSATAIFLGALAGIALSFAGLALSSLALAAAYRALVAARG
ncbi:MAG: hypothetical protein EXQ88_00240 [Alphaproteobacteria bacterium]|nr:hypothetical protein [Alphaproteobacteria bacterium]